MKDLNKDFKAIKEEITTRYTIYPNYYWLKVGGKEAIIPIRNYSLGWYEKATKRDFKRIVIY